MVRPFSVLLWPVALLTCVVATPPIAAAATTPRVQTLVFDAIFTHERTAGPGAQRVGHRQIASGILRDASGRRVGTFALTCTWIKVTQAGASERCAAVASAADGRLVVAGPSQSNRLTHTWRVIGGTGRYRNASGTVTVRDLDDHESLITATVTTRGRAVLRAGKVSRPPTNDAFIAQANDLCRRAAADLATLPPFPFGAFDPLRPDPSLLPWVGAFFTGPGDPRPILAALDSGLAGLGEPAGNRGVWRTLLDARDRELTVIDAQDRAALAADVPTFVRSVRDSATNFRQIAITATVFGAARCVI
jgi:hypothetical protein